MSGAWLEYVVEDEKLQAIADKLGYDSNLHITVCYFGRSLSENQIELAADLVGDWAKFFPKRFTVECPPGIAFFKDGDLAAQRLWVPERIHLQRTILLNDFYNYGVQFHNDFDWNPHITLGEADREAFDLLNFEQHDELTIKRLWLHHDFGDHLNQWSLE